MRRGVAAGCGLRVDPRRSVDPCESRSPRAAADSPSVGALYRVLLAPTPPRTRVLVASRRRAAKLHRWAAQSATSQIVKLSVWYNPGMTITRPKRTTVHTIHRSHPAPQNQAIDLLDMLLIQQGQVFSQSNEIELNRLSTLWTVNITKMHFQQNVCFQLRNWAIAITGVVIPLMWAGTTNAEGRIWLHFLTIAIICLILDKDLRWHGPFFRYRNRARDCEAALLKTKSIQQVYFDYSYHQDRSPSELLREALQPDKVFTLQTDYIEIYLVLILLLSLLATVFQNYYP
jgi:uncharacterized membrane protein